MAGRLDKKLNLIRELALKDLKIRYSRPALGFLWAFLSPFLMVGIFYFIFGIILKAKTENVPFVLYLMSGVFPWIFFQEAITRSVTSLMDNKNLIRESRFPHYLVPVSIGITSLVNFIPSLLILIMTSFFVLKGLTIAIFLLPFVIMIHFFIIAGLSIIFSILYVRWRDLKYFLDSVLLLLFYLTPACYSLSVARGSFSGTLFKMYLYNPLVGILELYRITLFKDWKRLLGLSEILSIQGIFIAVIFGSAFFLYKKHRNSINDYLSY